jgi:hypothetical protein
MARRNMRLDDRLGADIMQDRQGAVVPADEVFEAGRKVQAHIH